MAEWILLRLPSWAPGFECLTLHLRFFNLILSCEEKMTKMCQKEARIGHILL